MKRILVLCLIFVSCCVSCAKADNKNNAVTNTELSEAQRIPVKILQSTFAELKKDRTVKGPVDLSWHEPWFTLTNEIFCEMTPVEIFIGANDTRFVYCGVYSEIGDKERPRYVDAGSSLRYKGLYSGMSFSEAEEQLNKPANMICAETGPTFVIITTPLIEVNDRTIYANLIGDDFKSTDTRLVLSYSKMYSD